MCLCVVMFMLWCVYVLLYVCFVTCMFNMFLLCYVYVLLCLCLLCFWLLMLMFCYVCVNCVPVLLWTFLTSGKGIMICYKLIFPTNHTWKSSIVCVMFIQVHFMCLLYLLLFFAFMFSVFCFHVWFCYAYVMFRITYKGWQTVTGNWIERLQEFVG